MSKRAETDSVLLEVSGLKISRGETDILKGIDWRVETGQHWAILGANGSGKTSLLSALMAYLTPTDGEIRVLGEVYGDYDWHEMRQRIGMVSSAISQRIPPQECALETVLSGRNAQLGYWGRNRKADLVKAAQCLGRMGIRHLAERPWGVLSQGERQKVFIARALMAEPKILILDEPCAGLDPVARERFLVSLRKLASSRRSPGLVLVTHHVEEIFPEISHVLVLYKGRVLAAGPKREVLNEALMGKAFGAEIRLVSIGQDRWRMEIPTGK